MTCVCVSLSIACRGPIIILQRSFVPVRVGERIR